jgi:uncharacterized protein (TIGR03435 family)
MNRATRAALAAAILIAPLALARPSAPQAGTPSFEVASIKPYKDAAAAGGLIMIGGGCRGVDSPAGGPQMQSTAVMVGPGGPPPGAGDRGAPFGGGRVAGPAPTPIGRCVFTRMTLKMLINSAYRLTAMGGSLDQLLSGGPGWIATDAFDIEAKAEDPDHTTQDQLRAMLQNLLAERFKLKFHRERKETQGFELSVAKGGPKMKEATGTEGNGGGISMRMGGNPANGGMAEMNAPGSTITSIITFLSGRLGRTIQDKTGLTGKYNFSLSWTPGENETNGLGGMMLRPPAPPPTEASDPGVSLFTALQEQMGLRLESAKVTIDAMVIDSAERPVEP